MRACVWAESDAVASPFADCPLTIIADLEECPEERVRRVRLLD
jgi:hypothetical protein